MTMRFHAAGAPDRASPRAVRRVAWRRGRRVRRRRRAHAAPASGPAPGHVGEDEDPLVAGLRRGCGRGSSRGRRAPAGARARNARGARGRGARRPPDGRRADRLPAVQPAAPPLERVRWRSGPPRSTWLRRHAIGARRIEGARGRSRRRSPDIAGMNRSRTSGPRRRRPPRVCERGGSDRAVVRRSATRARTCRPSVSREAENPDGERRPHRSAGSGSVVRVHAAQVRRQRQRRAPRIGVGRASRRRGRRRCAARGEAHQHVGRRRDDGLALDRSQPGLELRGRAGRLAPRVAGASKSAACASSAASASASGTRPRRPRCASARRARSASLAERHAGAPARRRDPSSARTRSWRARAVVLRGEQAQHRALERVAGRQIGDAVVRSAARSSARNASAMPAPPARMRRIRSQPRAVRRPESRRSRRVAACGEEAARRRRTARSRRAARPDRSPPVLGRRSRQRRLEQRDERSRRTLGVGVVAEQDLAQLRAQRLDRGRQRIAGRRTGKDRLRRAAVQPARRPTSASAVRRPDRSRAARRRRPPAGPARTRTSPRRRRPAPRRRSPSSSPRARRPVCRPRRARPAATCTATTIAGAGARTSPRRAPPKRCAWPSTSTRSAASRRRRTARGASRPPSDEPRGVRVLLAQRGADRRARRAARGSARSRARGPARR